MTSEVQRVPARRAGSVVICVGSNSIITKQTGVNMPQVECPKCKSYQSCLVGLREAELLIILGILLMVFAFLRPQFWYLPIISFILAIIFYIPALAQHYRCKKCEHRWNAKKERSGLKWEKRKEGPDGDYHL